MEDFERVVGDFAKNSSEYVDLKITEIKIKTVKGLSMAMAKLSWLLLLMSVVSLLLMALGVAFVFAFGELLGGRYALGALLVALMAIVLVVVLFLMKDKIFKNSFVPLFVKLFFGEENE